MATDGDNSLMPNLTNPYSFPTVIREDLVLIGTATAGGGSNTLQITSIPATYNHLWCLLSGRSNGGSFSRSSMNCRFNSDAGATSYGDQQLQASFGGLGVANHQRSDFYCGEIPNASGPATYPGQIIFDLVNYKSSTYYKTQHTFCGYGYGMADWYIVEYADTWKSTAAVNDFKVTDTGGSAFIAGTKLWIYGY